MAAFGAPAGVTGCPILADALTYLEARVVDTLDARS
jgi:flavin reductase (DIM6/NTAB) family NADH-FMN oxidoreductase RutF